MVTEEVNWKNVPQKSQMESAPLPTTLAG